MLSKTKIHGVEIRQMRSADLDEVYVLMLASLDEIFRPEIPAYLLNQWQKGSLVAADYSGKILGYLGGAVLSGRRATISLLCVQANVRNNGIGTALIEHFFLQAKTEGIRTVQLEVRENNVQAIRFYTNRGFTTTEFLPSFYNDSGNGIRMISSTYGKES